MKKFIALRKAIYCADLQQKDIAKLLDITVQAVSNKMCGRYPFNQIEQYLIMDELRKSREILDYSQMHVLFPKNGIA